MTDLNPQSAINSVAAIAIKRVAIVDSGTRKANTEQTDENKLRSESKKNLDVTSRQHASADVAPELYNADTQESSQ